MQPTARQHDANLREQMRGKNMRKHDFSTVDKILFSKKESAVAREAFAANLCEHRRTLKTVLEAKTRDPSLMAKQPGRA